MAASLALGICMGVDFSDVLDGPDLLRIVKEVDPESIPQDVRAESLNGIAEEERARRGDWLAIWGGKLTSLSGPCPVTRNNITLHHVNVG